LTERIDGSKWWQAAWRANGKRVVRSTGVRYYPDRKDGGHWQAEQTALKLRDGPSDEKRIPAYRELVQSFYLPDSPYIALREADGRAVNRHWRKTLASLIETYCLDKWGDTPLDKLNLLIFQ
jgi:hypothetical protein